MSSLCGCCRRAAFNPLCGRVILLRVFWSLVDVLLKEIKSRVQVPVATSSADSEELIRAKAKLAQAGLTLTFRP